MGNVYGSIMHPEVLPNIEKPPTFDPLEGFPNGRKLKVSKLSQADFESAKIPLDRRDYCAHKLLDFYTCRHNVYPFVVKCHHEKHAYEHCLYEEYLTQMKEHERERRLLVRQKKQEVQAAA